MRSFFIYIAGTLFAFYSLADQKMETQLKTNSQDEWEILFDGTSFDAWKGYLTDKMPDNWRIEDDAMVFYPPEDKPEGAQYNIVTRKEYTNFVLSLEWKISKAGNSGIFWGVKEDEKYPQPYETGPEIQVLDNENHPDALRGTSHQAGALYDMVSPLSDVTKEIGQWNHFLITVNYDTNVGRVELNGQEIVSFHPSGEDWEEMVAKSKFADWQGFGKFPTGRIGLQDHGDQVAYRNIKIKEL